MSHGTVYQVYNLLYTPQDNLYMKETQNVNGLIDKFSFQFSLPFVLGFVHGRWPTRVQHLGQNKELFGKPSQNHQGTCFLVRIRKWQDMNVKTHNRNKVKLSHTYKW